MKKLIAVIGLLVVFLPAVGTIFTIKKLNTPSLTVNGVELKVGDRFTDDVEIKWKSDNQAVKLLSDDNKIYVLSGKSYKASGVTTFSDFVTNYKTLSTRGDGYPVSVQDHANMMSGTFVLLDSLIFETTWPSDNNSYFAISTPSGIKKLNSPEEYILITKEDTGISEGECNINVVYIENEDKDTTLISDRLHIVVPPAALDF